MNLNIKSKLIPNMSFFFKTGKLFCTSTTTDIIEGFTPRKAEVLCFIRLVFCCLDQALDYLRKQFSESKKLKFLLTCFFILIPFIVTLGK